MHPCIHTYGYPRGEYGGLVCLTKIVGPKLMLQLHNEAGRMGRSGRTGDAVGKPMGKP